MDSVKVHYQDKAARGLLLHALCALLDDIETDPIFICIGSDRHILDCFGPLTGTMLQANAPDLYVYGTLDQPVHAQNLLQGIKEARQHNSARPMVAVDASVGDEDEIGMIQLRQGGLVPGRAFSKNLPTVGQFSITGVVDIRVSHWATRKNKNQGLALVYRMAQLVSETIGDWHRSKHRS